MSTYSTNSDTPFSSRMQQTTPYDPPQSHAASDDASMATTEVPHVSDKTDQAGAVNGVQDGVGVQRSEGSSTKPADDAPASSADKPASKDVSPVRQESASSTALTRGGSINGTSLGTTNTPAISMPHPKKFSHVDINKRFLGKNSPVATVGNATSPSNANKPGLSLQKPAVQNAAMHSKLVTTKLTTDIQRSATTGPGWSRPPSTSSSLAATTSASAITPKLTAASASAPGHTAPQLPVVGKVIQPQPKAVVEAPQISRKDSSGKSAWGNAKSPAAALSQLDTGNNEFPTAAEVAQASGKLAEKKPVLPPTPAQKQAAVDADAFRGVHLGPNVHHWDEDEGDDSNFLDEVIQFDDGRQYTVQHTQDASSPSPSHAPSEVASRKGETHDEPVSKEERFADDFDRSWPPSRPAKAPSQSGQQSAHSPTASSQSLHSPQDPSRVLFNERSNRLEPYSSTRLSGPPRDPYFGRRGSRSDVVVSPTESRNGRDGPPSHSVQLLQKPQQGGRDKSSPDERQPSRSRMSGDRPNFAPPHDGSSFRDRDAPRRDYGGPSHMSRTTSSGFDHMRSRDQHDHAGPPPDRIRRTSNAGPPLVSSPSEISRDGRQIPPHLSSSHQQPSMWRAPSTTDRPRRQSTASSVGVAPPQQPSQSPISSHVALSPNAADVPLQSGTAGPNVDIDEVRKAAMHSAAERARLRRQQEEAERDKERERARRKAAELEAKMKAAEEEKAKLTAGSKAQEAPDAQTININSQAVSIIESVISTARAAAQHAEVPPAAVVEEKPAPARSGGAPSMKGVPRPARQQSGADSPSLATAIDSWRSKTVPRPLEVNGTQAPVISSPTVALPSALPLLPQVDHLIISKDETLEVVDFSEHGKLIGVMEEEDPAPATQTTSGPPRRLQRPVATDFFQDHEESQALSPVEANRTSWRRKSSAAYEQSPRALLPAQGSDTHAQEVETSRDLPRLQIHSLPQETSPTSAHARQTSFDDYGRQHTEQIHTEHGHALKSPQAHAYREAPMSALNDTMARIKGALDGMHKPEPKQKWLPPALRTKLMPGEVIDDVQPKFSGNDSHHFKEVFDVTGCEPPRSPKPAWNHFAVRLPLSSQATDPVSPKQLRFFAGQRHMRLDIFSIGPSCNNIFSKPLFVKGRPKFEVKLPQPDGFGGKTSPSNPVVKLPVRPGNAQASSHGAFGRVRDTDGVSSWRKPPSSPLKHQQKDLLESPVSELDTVSRSPPPEVPAATSTLSGQTDGTPVSPIITVPLPRAKAQSKAPGMPGVSFYRESPVDTTTVKFIVSSELEEDTAVKDASEVSTARTVVSEHSSVSTFPTLSTMSIPTPPTDLPLRPEPISSSKDPIVEFRKGNRSPVLAPITPPSLAGNLPSLTWAAQREASAKESPSRPPDREHLKAVWSSTSNKADTPSINSLQGIADDLPTVPLTMQEARLENIPTPPSSMATHASRMSIMHDITKTFQQVPISSSGSQSMKSGTALLPHSSSSNSHISSVTSPVHRPHQLSPAMPGGMRVPYPGYPSPMLSSPSPTLVYPPPMTPSPIPAPMIINGQYPPGMWMPMPPPNGPPGMMRPLASPYGHQLMPYPHTGAMYHAQPNMQGHAMASSTSARPGNVMLTPGGASQAQPGHPMYATSPVQMHAMPAIPGPGSSYPGSAQSRPTGPPRGPYDHVSGTGMMQPSPSFGQQQSPAGYSVPPNMFVRSTW